MSGGRRKRCGGARGDTLAHALTQAPHASTLGNTHANTHGNTYAHAHTERHVMLGDVLVGSCEKERESRQVCTVSVHSINAAWILQIVSRLIN